MSWWDRVKRLWRGSDERAMVRLPRSTLAALITAGEQRSLKPTELMPRGTSGKPKWTEYKADQAVRDFKKNSPSVWAYACVRLIARSVAAVRLEVQTQGADGKWEWDAEHPLQELLDTPNKDETGRGQRELLVWLLMLTGETMLTKIRSKAMGSSESLSGEGIPTEIYVAPLNRFDPIPSGDGGDGGLIEAYQDTIKKRRVKVYDIMHPRFADPENPYRGLPPLAFAMKHQDIDFQAVTWQMTSFQNRAIPDGVFTTAGDEWYDDEQWDALKEHIATEWLGSKNARVPMRMGSDLKFTPLSRSMVDMDFQGGSRLNREGVCAAYGVPPMLVGIHDRSTYSNFEQAEDTFHDHTVTPIVELLEDMYSTSLAPEFGEGIRVRARLERTKVAIRRVKQRWDVAKEMVDRGVPMAHANERFELGIDEYPGWDVPLVPANRLPLDAIVGGDTFDDEYRG